MKINSGLYQLTIMLQKTIDISVGKLGSFTFPEGYYIYTGSAKRNRESRIARHLNKHKKPHWHIDYLTQYGNVIHVKRYNGKLSECELNGKIQISYDADIIAKGFGSSDCSCTTHLFYLGLSSSPRRK
ncbi:MAG: GIY-YIG nuclease family protein [Nitrososphaerota archaeon]